MSVVALIAAAGLGRRMGSETPKAFLPLGPIPILAHTIKKFDRSPVIDEIVVLVPPGQFSTRTLDMVRELGLTKVSQVLPGGEERQDSVHIGLEAARGRSDWVLIHDGARPFVPASLIERSVAEVRRWKAVVAALPAFETLKEVSPEKEVLRTVDRRVLWMIQTPQSFHLKLIFEAYEEARKDGFQATDDAALLERKGFPVRVIEGSRLNFKITTSEDLALAEALYGHLERQSSSRPEESLRGSPRKGARK
ncbi:MAG TPA: 2-C-methyl-D-erythritol 4-phosphate cytidylyltransferase [Thermodesulfobacteriota bacterium]|nr:2-C-methyl-D-erythritol 4-phosphate cytidylyltransferase [Thermodesulfobacteriota bacterium]